MALTTIGKTNMLAMVYERVVHMLETLTKQVADSEERFRLMDHRLAKLEASKHLHVDKFDVINICSKKKESQERQFIDDLISVKEEESFKTIPWRVK